MTKIAESAPKSGLRMRKPATAGTAAMTRNRSGVPELGSAEMNANRLPSHSAASTPVPNQRRP
jgi:hypothetical protein